MTQPEMTLDVDLNAGFNAVAGHQLAGTWQVPAELVRMAIANGAREVEIRIQRRKVVVEAAGAVIPAGAVEGLATLLDGGADNIRLKALTAVEDLDSTALSWAVGADPSRLEINQRHPEGGVALERIGTARAQISPTAPTGDAGFRIVLVGSRIDTKQAVSWLETACRFAEIPVRLNGKDLRKALSSGCFRTRLQRPVPVVVALGVALESPRLWLLRHGVLEARVAVPGWPAFEAAVELSGEVTGWISAADLRRAVSPHLPGIIEGVVGVMLRVVPRLPTVSVRCRSALVEALLTAVEKQVKKEEVLQAPIFEIIEGGHSGWVSLDDLGRQRASLPAVAESMDQCKNHRGRVLYLGPKERVRVAAILGVGFHGARTANRTVLNQVRDGLGLAVKAIWGLLGAAPLQESLLDPAERGLARGLAGCLVSASGRVSVVFVPGDGSVRQSRRILRLPRDNPVVRTCARIVTRDSRWLYPAARALGSGHYEIDDTVRRAWVCDDGQREPPF